MLRVGLLVAILGVALVVPAYAQTAPKPKLPVKPETPGTEKKKCPGGWAACPDYYLVDTSVENAELRRYFGGLWVSRVIRPDTYRYSCEASYYWLSDYFNGGNYERAKIPSTTPLLITMDLWDMTRTREARFFLTHKAFGRIPPPISPVHLVREKDRWYYTREMEATTDLRKIMHTTFNFLADLVVDRQKVDTRKVHVAMFNYPIGTTAYSGKNEVWIEQPIYTPGPRAYGRYSGGGGGGIGRGSYGGGGGGVGGGRYDGRFDGGGGGGIGMNGMDMSADDLRAMGEAWLNMDEERDITFDPPVEDTKYLA